MSPFRTASLARPIVLMVLLPCWCVVLFAMRFARVGLPGYGFLVWNLVLAVAPAAAAMRFTHESSRGTRGAVQALWFVLWLLFLPNAPYIVTDFMHLRSRPPVPMWFDIALVTSFAGTGLALGYSSVADVQAVLARRFGRAAGWSVAIASLLLSGLGIYMGRFLRWNSWDAVLRPHVMLPQLANDFAEPGTAASGAHVTLVYGLALVIGYVAVRLVVPRDANADSPRPRTDSLE